jgi:hypothetical protein
LKAQKKKKKTKKMTRLVFSFTTIPSRLSFVYETLESALNQTRAFDQIYVILPQMSKRGKSFDPKEILRLQQWIARHPKGTSIRVLRPDLDHGPIMKILPVLDEELDDETLLLFGDDDRKLLPGFSNVFYQAACLHPDAALSLSGWCAARWQLIRAPRQFIRVDWIQGTDGICVRRRHFNSKDLLAFPDTLEDNKVRELLERHDDHRIGFYLSQNKIPCLVLPCTQTSQLITHLPHSNLDAISGQWSFFREVYSLAQFGLENQFYSQITDDDFSSIPVLLFFLVIFLLIIVFCVSWALFPARFGSFLPQLYCTFLCMTPWFYITMKTIHLFKL